MLAETIRLIQGNAWRMECLEAIASLGLPDWYIAAGFLRNAIWDASHAKPVPTALNDVDVIYYDPGDGGTAAEAQIESVLRTRGPIVTWEARNQARMHLRNGHAPYRDSAHAMAHWIETPTCVGVRMRGDRRLEIVAPYGIEENWSLRLAPIHASGIRPLCSPSGCGRSAGWSTGPGSGSSGLRRAGATS
jgi:uncharacterized protein